MILVSTVPSNQTTVNANAPQEALDTDGFIRKLHRFGTSASTDELHVIAPYFNNGQFSRALGAEQKTQDSSLSMASETQKRKEDEKWKISELEHKKKGLALSRF